MWNAFRCENCGMESEEKPTIIRFSYKLTNGKEGVELIYLCRGCSSMFPKTNPARHNHLVKLFKGLHPNWELAPE